MKYIGSMNQFDMEMFHRLISFQQMKDYEYTKVRRPVSKMKDFQSESQGN